MKRASIWLALAALLSLAVDALGDLTQDRADAPAAGSRSEILLEVRNRNLHGSMKEAAEGLWGVCQGTLHNRLAPRGIVAVSPNRFLIATVPAVGEHSWRRLRGCLEDLTVDQVLARVVSKRDVPPGPHGGTGGASS